MKKPLSKKQRKKLFSRKPSNLAFWMWSIASEKDLKAFMERGDERQVSCIIRTLNYTKKFDREYFDRVDGEKLLKIFKGKINEED